MGLSLYNIEDGLDELLEARLQLTAEIATLATGQPDNELLAERREELAAVETTLAEYQKLEVAKVDNTHRFLTSIKHLVPALRAEAALITARAKRLEEASDWLKGRIMEAMDRAGKKRVDGNSGRYLLKKGNGGIAKLQVDGWDEDRKRWTQAEGVLPEEFIDVTVRMSASEWERLITNVSSLCLPALVSPIVSEPSQERIRAALAVRCETCGGSGEKIGYALPCETCKGTKCALVPGARLLERGAHIEVK